MLGNLGYKHTLRICNTFCFSTAAVVSRTRLIVMFYTYIACFFGTGRRGNGGRRHFSARKFPNHSRAKTDRPISERLSFLNYCLWHLCWRIYFQSFRLAAGMLTCLSIFTCHLWCHVQAFSLTASVLTCLSIFTCYCYADMLKHFHLSLMVSCSSIFTYSFCIDML